MNLSFAKLGTEECELCDEYTIHIEEHQKQQVVRNQSIEVTLQM